jgi:surface carbohydrate biosynthesis protein (TIGR04326 family)
MHAWEKALNAAKENSKSGAKVIGFQYAAVSRNYLNYFYHRSETTRSSDPLQMPLPDILACNGKNNQALFESYDYPCVRGVEAVRQMYLKRVISLPIPARSAKPVLLVAGSIDQKESTALISLVQSAFPQAGKIDIWFKGHPLMPFEELFEKERIELTKTGYFICHDNITNCLQKAWAVLVPTSTVAIEALAFGCEVIVPVFPNSILMNPLADYELCYQRVTTPEELKGVLDKISNRGLHVDIDARRKFIEDYFFLNPSLSRWENLLTSSNG